MYPSVTRPAQNSDTGTVGWREAGSNALVGNGTRLLTFCLIFPCKDGDFQPSFHQLHGSQSQHPLLNGFHLTGAQTQNGNKLNYKTKGRATTYLHISKIPTQWPLAAAIWQGSEKAAAEPTCNICLLNVLTMGTHKTHCWQRMSSWRET